MTGNAAGVRSQGPTRLHACHWPNCSKQVPPAIFMCRAHWFSLPKDIRDRIWMTYVPGQEETKTPSAAYLAVAREAQAFARNHVPAKRAAPPAPQAALF